MEETKGVTVLPPRAARGVRRAVVRAARVGDGRAPGFDWDEIIAERQGVWTFVAVEERLVEAWRFLMRMPDRERGWMRVVASDGPWGEVVPERLDRFEEAAPARIGLRAAEVDRMEETLGWLRFTRPVDRKLIGLALRQLAAAQAHVVWGDIKHALGWSGTPDALRMRYSRAITAIARGLNGAKGAENVRAACQGE